MSLIDLIYAAFMIYLAAMIPSAIDWLFALLGDILDLFRRSEKP